MFRECYFEYAGVSSQSYNLMLCYVGSANTDFDSGGKFDLSTDTLPHSHETLLYSKDYSAQPLEFEVELINTHGNIPPKQMIEIKNWLFGQDGWKTFRCIDDRQDYCLKCVFIPGEDIADGSGYRGLRCTIKNASPFWYGDERSIKVEHSTLINGGTYCTIGGKYYNVFWVDVPRDNCVDAIIYPTLNINIDKTASGGTDERLFRLFTCDANVAAAAAVTDGQWVHPNSSELSFDISYVGAKGDESSVDTVIANTKYLTIKSTGHSTQTITLSPDTNKPLPVLNIKFGLNVFRILYGWNYTDITFKYTPLYRMGAF